MQLETALYLVPVEISESSPARSLPPFNMEVVSGIRHFIVENVRTARRCLRRWHPGFPIDDCTFMELNGHTPSQEINSFLSPLRSGYPVAVMSEAGCPAVADPGAAVVAVAQAEGLKVVPLVGPSSILMALMGSGFNGQGFAFNGYLPVHADERTKALRSLEAECERTGRTQIFIETPYRNNRMLASLVSSLRPDTSICVACDMTDPVMESIVTRTAGQWKRITYDYDKRPAIFLIHRNR